MRTITKPITFPKRENTIRQKLDDIAASFCEKYCKHYDTWDKEAEGMELVDSTVCKTCPIWEL